MVYSAYLYCYAAITMHMGWALTLFWKENKHGVGRASPRPRGQTQGCAQRDRLSAYCVLDTKVSKQTELGLEGETIRKQDPAEPCGGPEWSVPTARWQPTLWAPSPLPSTPSTAHPDSVLALLYRGRPEKKPILFFETFAKDVNLAKPQLLTCKMGSRQQVPPEVL